MALNADQALAAQLLGDNCLVVACPGSGKTRVICAKIEALLRVKPTAHVVAVTFTKAAATDLLRRIGEAVGPKRAGQACTIGTFHSLALKHVKRREEVGRLLNQGEQEQYFERAWRQCGLDCSLERAAELINHGRALFHRSQRHGEQVVLCDAYESLLRQNNVLDFQDVMARSVELMSQEGACAVPCDLLLVDEFQDCDSMQLEWTLQFSQQGVPVTVVADDDQSIFGFRNGMGFLALREFEKRARAKRVTLGVNYRCKKEILDLADDIIQLNANRMPKALVAARGAGGKVALAVRATREDECLGILSDLSVVIKGPDRHSGQCAVLGRTNLVIDAMEAEIAKQGLPYSRLGGRSFWAKRPVTFLVGLLRSLIRHDDAAVDQCLHWAGFSDSGLAALREALNGEMGALTLRSDGRCLTSVDLDAVDLKIVEGLVEFAPRWRALLRSPHASDVNAGIANVGNWMVDQTDRAKNGKSTEEDRNESLPARLLKAASQALCRLDGALSERLFFVSSVSQRSSTDTDAPIVLCTLHASKGLEFQHVWLMGLESGTFPSTREDVNIEEERRLMYVGITRAKDSLRLSRAEKEGTASEFFMSALSYVLERNAQVGTEEHGRSTRRPIGKAA